MHSRLLGRPAYRTLVEQESGHLRRWWIFCLVLLLASFVRSIKLYNFFFSPLHDRISLIRLISLIYSIFSLSFCILLSFLASVSFFFLSFRFCNSVASINLRPFPTLHFRHYTMHPFFPATITILTMANRTLFLKNKALPVKHGLKLIVYLNRQ